MRFIRSPIELYHLNEDDEGKIGLIHLWREKQNSADNAFTFIRLLGRSMWFTLIHSISQSPKFQLKIAANGKWSNCEFWFRPLSFIDSSSLVLVGASRSDRHSRCERGHHEINLNFHFLFYFFLRFGTWQKSKQSYNGLKNALAYKWVIISRSERFRIENVVSGWMVGGVTGWTD